MKYNSHNLPFLVWFVSWHKKILSTINTILLKILYILFSTKNDQTDFSSILYSLAWRGNIHRFYNENQSYLRFGHIKPTTIAKKNVVQLSELFEPVADLCMHINIFIPGSAMGM